MNDREIFRKNLNYYLNKSGKLQKDLADYVGAKTTTVSGWTRGISYPRADAMEKIAMFFGITTSALVGKLDDEDLQQVSGACQNASPIIVPDSALFIEAVNSLSPEDLSTLNGIFSLAFSNMKNKESE